MAAKPMILFAGGGSGGHIFPNFAILEELRRLNMSFEPHFLVADRELDHRLLAAMKIEYTPLIVTPVPSNPLKWMSFWSSWKSSIRDTDRLLSNYNVLALVSTGGFVSGPAVKACAKAGVPVVLVNLDSVPGRANTYAAKYAMTTFTVYPNVLPRAHRIAMPMRRGSTGPRDKGMSRKQLKVIPSSNMLLVVGGSQGSSAVNGAMVRLTGRDEFKQALKHWQIYHITGGKGDKQIREHYKKKGITATVVPFCGQMGLAWSGANLAISRAGAGSVAEAWANGCPTLFLPYPYHKDQHQVHNAKPMVDKGGAILVTDHKKDVDRTAADLGEQLLPLLGSPDKLNTMHRSLLTDSPKDGALEIAQWLRDTLGHGED